MRKESDEEFARRVEAEYEQHCKDCATTDPLRAAVVSSYLRGMLSHLHDAPRTVEVICIALDSLEKIRLGEPE